MEISVRTKMKGETATTRSSGPRPRPGRMAMWEPSAYRIPVQSNGSPRFRALLTCKAMVPAMTFSTPQNFFYAGGTWDMSWIEWIWDNIAWDTRTKKNLPGPRTYKEAVAAWKEEGAKMLNTVPLLDVKPLQQSAPYYFDWLQHPPEDPWWNWSELREKYPSTQRSCS